MTALVASRLREIGGIPGQGADAFGDGLNPVVEGIGPVGVTGPGRGDLLLGVPGGSPATPPHRRLALGVGSGDQQATEQADVLEELGALHSSGGRVVDIPEIVCGDRGGHQCAGQDQRRESGCLTRGQEHTAADLGRGVDPHEGLGAVRDAVGDRVRQYCPGLIEAGLRRGGAPGWIPQGTDATGDEDRGEHRAGDSAKDHASSRGGFRFILSCTPGSRGVSPLFGADPCAAALPGAFLVA